MSVTSMITDAGTTFVVEKLTSAKDATGGVTNTWTTLYSGVIGRFESTGSGVIEEYGQKFLEDRFRVYTQQSGIGIGHRLLVSGMYRRVIGVNVRDQRSPAIDTWYEVDCVQQTPMP